MWRLIAALLPLVTASSAFATLNSGPWPMFHRGADHRGFTTLEISATNALSWSRALGDTVEFSSPAVDSRGYIYIGDSRKDLWALYPPGTEEWRYRTGGNLRYGSPAVAQDGTVYVGSNDGRLYAIRSHGSLRWTAVTGGAVKTAPAIGADGTIYVGSDDGRLYAVRASDGQTIWSYLAGDTIRSSPAIGPDGTIYFGCNDGQIRALWPNGTLRWFGATGGPIKTAPAVYLDRVVFGSGDGFLYTVHRQTGALVWAAYTGNNLRSSPAIGITGKIYFGMGSKIVCYRDDGYPSWEFPTGGRVYSSPAVRAGIDSIDVVVCGSDDGNLYALRNGVPIWTAAVGSPIRSSPAIGMNGFVYVGAMNGRIYAFGEMQQAGLPTIDAGGALRLVLGPNPALTGQEVTIRLVGSPLGSLPAAGTIAIVDAQGRVLRRFGNGAPSPWIWDGRDDQGRPAAAGVYLARWQDGLNTAQGRLVRIR